MTERGEPHNFSRLQNGQCGAHMQPRHITADIRIRRNLYSGRDFLIITGNRAISNGVLIICCPVALR